MPVEFLDSPGEVKSNGKARIEFLDEPQGKPLIPEPMMTGNVLLDTVQGTAHDVAPAALSFLDNLTGGAIGFSLKKQGFTLPEAEGVAAKSLDFMAKVGGFLGGPFKAGKLLGQTVFKGTKLGSFVGREGLALGTAGFLQTNPNKEDFLQLGDRSKQAAILGTVGAVFGALGKASLNIKNATKLENQVDLARRVRSEWWNARDKAVKSFGDGLDKTIAKHPKRTADITNQLGTLLDDIEVDKATQLTVNRIPALKKIINDGTVNVNVKDIQKIMNEIKKTIGERAFSQGANSKHSNVLDFWYNLRDAQLSAFPEMAPIRAAYKETITRFNLLKRATKEGGTFNKLRKGFPDPEQELASRELLTNNDILKEIGGMRTAFKLLVGLSQISKEATRFAVAGTVGAVALQRIFERDR